MVTAASPHSASATASWQCHKVALPLLEAIWAHHPHVRLSSFYTCALSAHAMPSRLGLGACLLLSTFGRCLGDTAAVERFREYLRLRTAQPTPDYEAAATFLTQQGRDIGHVQHTPFWWL